MKSIIIISPHYLESIFKESKKYSFMIHGYGTAQKAKNSLIYANLEEILGFALVYDTLPSANSKEFKDIVEFARLCNSMKSNRKFLVVTRGNAAELGASLKEFKNLRFFVVQNLEYITDVVINKNVFGSILLDNYQPYELRKEEKVSINDIESTTLSFTPCIPGYLFEIFTKVLKLETVEDTVLYDKCYLKYKTINPIVADLRRIFIMEQFSEDTSDEEVLLLKQIETLDAKMHGLYSVCLDMIKYHDTAEMEVQIGN